MAKIYGNTTATPLSPNLFGSGGGADTSNKMDKFGEVFFAADEKDPTKTISTTVAIESPTLVLNKILEESESREDALITLKGVTTPSNASDDTVASKRYVDEAIKNIDISGVDTDNLMKKFGEVSDDGSGYYIVNAPNTSMKMSNINVDTIQVSGKPAATIEYVNDKVGSIEAILDTIIAMQDSILGGGA